MENDRQPEIVTITSCAVPGVRKTFVNVYGLDKASRVWQWNARDGRWEPNKIPEKSRDERGFER
jgi:hypothetical protein